MNDSRPAVVIDAHNDSIVTHLRKGGIPLDPSVSPRPLPTPASSSSFGIPCPKANRSN